MSKQMECPKCHSSEHVLKDAELQWNLITQHWDVVAEWDVKCLKCRYHGEESDFTKEVK